MLPSVRDASAADAEAIARVARASWTDTYHDIFEPEFIEQFMADAYDLEGLAASAERAAGSEDEHFLVAERDGSVVAFAQYGEGRRGPELFASTPTRRTTAPARVRRCSASCIDGWPSASRPTWSTCTRATSAAAPSTSAMASSWWVAATHRTAT